jgi:FtsP/CotA-like multicopper oxidase with cupredoxin domain
MPSCRDLYLKIERMPGYSPLASDDAERNLFRRDCMFNHGHEDGKIPDAEVALSRLDAIVYREYLDPGYTVPNADPLITADINEPAFDRRIPGSVLYADPGERLFIHVLNADEGPHSFHVHGLIYGIDGDGAWPFGVHGLADPGPRSDTICPGETWTYVYDVTDETIGAWPYHDHHMMVGENTNRGLFGGLVVRDPHAPKADYEVPFFLHRLAGPSRTPLFDSGPLNPGDTFSFTFAAEGTYEYHCNLHPMSGRVRVTAAGPTTPKTVQILDNPAPGRFDPDDVTVGPGTVVTWTHAGGIQHTVTDSSAGGRQQVAINGRAYVGNTPTIVAETGKRIRWYVFNLDLGEMFHNFHPHGQRFRVGNEWMDVRGLSPAESFVVDTIVPPVILVPECDHDSHYGGGSHGGSHEHEHDHGEGEHGHGSHGHEHGEHEHGHEEHGHDDDDHEHPHEHEKVKLCGDFLVHCHVEMHMMQGMAALVRAVQEVEVTPGLEEKLGFHLPVCTGKNECPDVDHLHACGGPDEGKWESLPDSPVFVVHAAVLRTGKVLLFSGTAEVGYPNESRVLDPVAGTFSPAQPFDQDLFCSGHAWLEDGRLLVAGGAPNGSVNSTHLFDPVAESWTAAGVAANMARARWYPTVLTLADGRILAVSGLSGVAPIEIYDPGANTWTAVAGADHAFNELYPSLHLLPGGDVFYSRAGWAFASGTQTAYLRFTGANAGAWTDLGQQQFYDRQEGTAVIQIDTTVSPPAATIFIIGGGVAGAATARNPQSAERIDVTTLSPAPSWQRNPPVDMNFPRTNVNGVLLPDGTILAVGGQRNGKWSADPQPVLQAEIYHPATNTWTLTAPMAHPRQYHSVAVLLPDGRVLTAGGIDPTLGGAPARDQRHLEVFSPSYLLAGARPVITNAPASVAYGATFDIETPTPGTIDSVALMRPCAMTHHTDAGQRYVKLPITGRTPDRIHVTAPASGNIAPPGYYMLFILDPGGIPSVGRFVHLP